MIKRFSVFDLSKIDFPEEKRRIENFIIVNKPKKISKENIDNIVEGFFGFFELDGVFGGEFYHKEESTTVDPYTKKSIKVPQIDTTTFLYLKKGDRKRLFLTGPQRDHVLKLLDLNLEQRKTLVFDPDYIEYVNTAKPEWQCYNTVLANAESVGREGRDERGHIMREKYLDLGDRDRVERTRFRYFAKVKLSLSNGVYDVTIVSDNTFIMNNFKGSYVGFSAAMDEFLEWFRQSYNNFVNCQNKGG